MVAVQVLLEGFRQVLHQVGLIQLAQVDEGRLGR